uniref:Putative reverse transcriptase domain, viral movement protein n=1 Tax=Tanacetum cinerariifolium TaxID=118510 RepID=A0A6L2NQY6_TANCI|nr:putative reverse transcriptase domain, viral movement protein [Tanacetum cinerariifolium]
MDYEEFDIAESFEHLFMAEPENTESTVQFDAKDYKENQENPNQETPTGFPKSDIKQYFTFDDVPPSKWHERSIKMLTWCTAELQYYTIDVVIKRFLTRLQGRLRDCPLEHIAHAREEFLKMKCYDVNLKQVFLNSFPESLGNEACRALEAKNVTIAQTTLGELYQLILNALAKLCNQKKFLAEFERTGKRLGTACDDKYLQIKCKDKSSCDCTHTKKKFLSKRFSGHFARNCPDKKRSQALIQALNQVEPVDVSDLESLYSLDDEPSDSVLCTVAYSDLSSDDDSDTEISILNPNILPYHYWKPHHQNFMAANREKIFIDKISVPINIQLFPKCMIKRRLLGSSSHGKDLLIGFDILHKLPNLCWISEGLHYRSFFNTWTAMHRLFVASITPPIFNINIIKQRLIQTCCASSHTEFLTKHPLPLWLNPSFFVSLPFKQNEDVNPTKASHPGMNPDHYQLAKEECEQLVSQGIIKPTTSPWACKAFYVNKRSEQVRGKLRLVINYQPLNHFLADDKFPLSQKKSLFQYLADAKVLSKFDLKYGFWQLGIKLEDRPKTAFCIPDHHYQWKSHAELLSKFYSLVTKYRIMLLEKKMEVGVTTIQFLDMEISDGKYQPQPHVAQELLKFPDELSSQKMIQQFLGLVNYMADFLPKLSHHTAWLFPMLKNNPSQWTSRQIDAVKAIKSLAEKIPPLKIPASSKKESYRQMQVMSVRERSYLFRIIIIKDTFVDIKVACSKHLRNTITPRLKKSLQSNKALRIQKKDAPPCTAFEVVKLVFTVKVHNKLLSYVVKSKFKDVPPHSKHLLTMLQWFVPHHQWTRWLTTTGKGIYVLVMFRRPGSFLPPKAINDDGSTVYHASYYFIHNCKDHPDAYKWIEANGQWLYDNFDHCEVETSDDDDDARSLWSSDDDEYFDPFKDDPTHPDACWSP